MSKIDPTQAVNQADLEAANNDVQQPQYTATFVDNDSQPIVEEQVEVTQNEEVQEQSGTETNIADEGGVAELIEDAAAPAEQEEVQPEGQTEVEDEVIEISAEPVEAEPTEIAQPEITSETDLPDWVQKLVDFHKDTGGGLEEYQQYTKDFESLSDTQLLQEYYKATKPGYTAEDIDLLIDSKFSTGEYEEGAELSREDKLKRLALKDEVIAAKQFLNANKDKYYADLKSGVQGAPEQYKEAVEFYDSYKKQQEQTQAIRDVFIEDSKKVFNADFKGFPFEAGDKKYRISVGDGQAVMNSQLDLNDVVNQFVDESGNIADVAGWHKALWAAQNADKLFNAGIEAGKALAIKERAKETKNPSYTNEGPSTTPSSQYSARIIPPKTSNF